MWPHRVVIGLEVALSVSRQMLHLKDDILNAQSWNWKRQSKDSGVVVVVVVVS